ncbi:helicase with zinc finger domain 2-like [Saccostrea echinata]|uniref:helicase with zinc finger domain 2-like n=1 Tax=Saccostrea echinata TaxID=191078 RepID=UPI002A7F5FB7|nr:helicase with zinc finger domain 2-like [Saccostrea echinata]
MPFSENIWQRAKIKPPERRLLNKEVKKKVGIDNYVHVTVECNGLIGDKKCRERGKKALKALFEAVRLWSFFLRYLTKTVSILDSHTLRFGSRRIASPNLSRRCSLSESVFGEEDYDSIFADSDSASDNDFEENEFAASRFEESRQLYSGGEEEHSRVLQQDIMQYGLELSNTEMFKEKEGRPFYDKMSSVEILEKKLKDNPHRFKRCKFNVRNSHESLCNILDLPDIDGLEEIQISGRSKAGRVFDGDIVLVEVYNYVKYREEFISRYQRDINRNNKLHRIYGRVVGIFERKNYKDIAHPVFVCVLDETSNFLVRPVCKTVPKLNIINDYRNPNIILVHKYDKASSTIKVQSQFKIDPKTITNFTFLVVFIRWTDFHPYPLAAVIKVIRIEESKSSALQILRLQHQVPKYYQRDTVAETEEILRALDTERKRCDEDREDLTALRVFTIDPTNSKDLDDALSIERVGENYRIGVHIADVGAVIKKDDAIDLEAQERSCTFYPGQGINPYHMLPEPFASNICSILPGVPRPTITVFFTVNKKGIMVKNFEIKKTIVKSSKQFTYEEVQNIIMNNVGPVSELDEDILLLFKIAKFIRFARIQTAMFSLPIETKLNEAIATLSTSREAHYLVEEFMILANVAVAQFLKEIFPEVIPLRCQQAPSRDLIEKWIYENSPVVHMVLRLQGIHTQKDQESIGLHQVSHVLRYRYVMAIQKWVWENLFENIKNNDLDTAEKLICTDELHPMQCLALEDWISFQETAFYKCSGTNKNADEIIHFSLKMNFYVHFTSPIRRYPDIVINRLIHAALENTECPYSVEDVSNLCEGFNSNIRRAKQFQKQCQMMFWGLHLKKTPKVMHGIVRELADKSVSIIIPGFRSLPTYCKELPLNLLQVSSKPKNMELHENEYLVLQWLRRLYDVNGKPNASWQKLSYRERETFSKKINPNLTTKFIPQETWKIFLSAVIKNKLPELRQFLLEGGTEDLNLLGDGYNFIDGCHETVFDHTSEVESGNVIKQACEYSMTFTRGQVFCVQLSAEPHRGIFSPTLQLFDMTSSINYCLQHTRDPIKFLSSYSSLKPLQMYPSPVKYLSIWLPLVEMEAVTSAVDDDSISINNVQVTFESKRIGHFMLHKRFTDQRDIDFSVMSEKFVLQGEDEPDRKEFNNTSFLCIRSKHMNNQPVGTNYSLSYNPNDRNYCILHAQVTRVEKLDKKPKSESGAENGRQKNSKTVLKVHFKLHPDSCAPSDAMLYTHNPSPCTIEIIPKSETDTRIQVALGCISQSTDVAKKIALNQKGAIRLNSWYSDIASRMNVEVKIPNIVPNNEFQKNAIKKSLTSTFSLIHGPPGTGKTHTGIKLVYLFDKINSKMEEQGHSRMHVVFCGPNNKSVDMVARWMLQKYDKECPDIVRLYGNSLECKVFPILGKYFSKRASSREYKPDPALKDVSVHNLIRLEDKPFSEEIRRFDELFRKYDLGEYEPTLADLKKYRKLTSEATQMEIMQHHVIFCTTAVATSPRFIKALSGEIRQLIIDEAGMCTEPESVAAVIATKAKQVVLIGDHKQLRPVLKSSHAAELGLEKSLFERYSERATMLRIQYRMHPGICAFPSNEFYDGRLLTESSPKWDIPNPLKIWVNRDKIPIVFCHIEGEEEFLTVSTEEGNEQSCSNKQEVDQVVKVLTYLIEREKLDLTDKENLNIMSQYNAQCHQIRLAVSSIAEGINVNTVVASQGGEWNYVIFSTVRSLPRYRIEGNPTLGWRKKSLGFISDDHQINVALTRARRGLIIIGNKHLLSCDPVWKNLINHYARLGCVVDEGEEFPRPV